jgi:hypothetical protein
MGQTDAGHSVFLVGREINHGDNFGGTRRRRRRRGTFAQRRTKLLMDGSRILAVTITVIGRVVEERRSNISGHRGDAPVGEQPDVTRSGA